jgi:cytochrome P450
MVTALLAAIDPADIRDRATRCAIDALDAGTPATTVARTVPVAVLAAALGIDVDVTANVTLAARDYLIGPPPDGAPDADAAVAALVTACGGVADERTAARIAVLVQACQATAELIDSVLGAFRDHDPRAPVENVVVETLRYDPPARAMRRVCTAGTTIAGTPASAGTDVILDLVAANRDPRVFADPDRFDARRPDADRHLAFGTGLRPCPGRDHATALAAGVVSAVLAVRAVSA